MSILRFYNQKLTTLSIKNESSEIHIFKVESYHDNHDKDLILCACICLVKYVNVLH